jgi:hypothetical protein
MAEATSVYKRPRHNKIARVLDALDPDLLLRTEAFFGGGTAITLSLDEYRESIDIDFMCASREGFAELRARTFDKGLPALLKTGRVLQEARELRRDAYGIRSWIEMEGTSVKIEIVSEARIDLEGFMNERFGVPTLARHDMYAEKLLANADRGADPASGHRDLIDLGMMIAEWGPIPDVAWKKADAAYQGRAAEAFHRYSSVLRSGGRFDRCAREMDIAPAAAARIMDALGGPIGPEKGSSRAPDLDD